MFVSNSASKTYNNQVVILANLELQYEAES